MDKINITKIFLPDKETFIKYIDKIYSSGWVTNDGPFVKEFEKKLENFLGIRNVVVVSNGTLALQIAYRCLNIKGSALTTPYSFVATTSSLVWEGIKPIFADINKKTLTLEPTKIKKHLSKDITGIVPVHVYGNACEIDEINDIANQNNLKVVYDAAHCIGVKYKNKSIFNYGDASIVSFHATKLFHTIEGGAILTNDDHIAEEARLMRNFGISGEDKIESVGINAKMNEIEAAMGLALLDNIESLIADRYRVWNVYYNNLLNYVEFPELNPDVKWNFSYVPVLFKNESQLEKVKEILNANNIFPRRYFYPSLDTLTYLNNQEKFPISNNISKRVLCMPNFFGVNDDTINSICELIKSEIKKSRVPIS